MHIIVIRRCLSRYLDGDVYFQAFAPITSTETRLVPFDDSTLKQWDNKKYEDQLFYFNTRARPAVYEHAMHGAGLDHCYDCTSEIAILKQWLLRNEPSLSDAQLNERVAEESLRISRSLDSQRTLASGNADPGLRRAGIVQRQSIEGRPAYRVHTEARGFAVSEAANVAQKRGPSDSPSLPPGKVQRITESHHPHPGAGAVHDHDANSRNSSFVGSRDDREHAPDRDAGFRDRADSAPRSPRNLDESRNDDYQAQSRARFDVDKYSKMLGIGASGAVSSNYAITAGVAASSGGSNRGLGFTAAGASGASSSYARNEYPREKSSSQPSRPSNAHIFPHISCFRQWLSVYLYSRIMQGPNRFLDLSLRSLSEIQAALAYCWPSVYIHGHISCTAAPVAPTAQEQAELVQRFPSTLFRGFALNFSGKDGSLELSQICSSCRSIAEIDIVDVGLLAADIVMSEAALISILDSFHAVCAPACIMQGRTSCSIDNFTRFLLCMLH
jgi:hypothetical protein